MGSSSRTVATGDEHGRSKRLEAPTAVQERLLAGAGGTGVSGGSGTLVRLRNAVVASSSNGVVGRGAGAGDEDGTGVTELQGMAATVDPAELARRRDPLWEYKQQVRGH